MLSCVFQRLIACRMDAVSSAGAIGLSTYSTHPSSIAFCAMGKDSWQVRITASVSGQEVFIHSSSSMPDIRGISRSQTRTCTGSWRRIFCASTPFAASSTRSTSRFFQLIERRMAWIASASSSTIRTVVTVFPPFPAVLCRSSAAESRSHVCRRQADFPSELPLCLHIAVPAAVGH